MVPSRLRRVALTALWVVSLGLCFQWWELKLRFPRLLAWTCVFLALFLVTALLLYGRSLRERRREVWVPAATWALLVLGAFAAASAISTIGIRGRPVPTAMYLEFLDIVFPIWIVVRVMVLLWDAAARAIVLASLLPLFLLYTWWLMVRMPGSAYAGPLAPLSADEEATRKDLETHVRTLAGSIGERNYTRPRALEAAAEYLEGELERLGYDASSQPFTVRGQSFRNLELVIRGVSRPDEVIVVGGHYDTVEGSPGADDNGTGAAAVLSLARLLARERLPRTVRFVWFANEEPPFFDTDDMGSRFYAADARRRGDQIVAMLSLETIGYYAPQAGSQHYPFPLNFFYPDRGDFIGFVGNLASRGLVRNSIAVFRRETRFPSQGAAAPAWIPGVAWSDHASFWRQGYRAIMISDTAPFRYPYYHSELDTADRIDYARLARVVHGLAHVVRALAGG